MPTLREVLVTSGRESKVDEATLALGLGEEPVPWFVKVAVGAGTWFGAFCVGFALVLSGIAESAGASVVFGLMLVGGAVLVSRTTTWLATPQVVLVASLGGQALVMLHLVKDLHQVGVSLVFASFQLVLLFAIRDATHRFLSAASAVVALWFAFEPPNLVGLVVPAVALVVAAELFLRDTAFAVAGSHRFSRPTAYGTVVSALGIHVGQAIWLQAEFSSIRERAEAAGATSFVSLGSVVVALAAIGVGVRVGLQAMREAGVPMGRARLATVVAAVVTALVSFRVPGLAVAFVLLVVAHARREVVLGGFACTAIAVFFGVFYFSLEMPLLEKAGWIGGTGVVFLALFSLGFRGDDVTVSEGRRWLPTTREGQVVALTALASVLLVGGLATSRESTRRTGTRVLLPLAPVDPRSLIQGDYMQLAYAVTDEVTRTLEYPRFADARVRVRLDPSGVATFLDVNPTQDPAPDEVVLLVRIRDGRARIGAESFFFEEGQAERYEHAKYGELRVSAGGAVLLTGLVDEGLNVLGGARE